ncbi:hypothetical protein ETB97_007414 [Aspergillus alliaceus]|uniref:Uncharacterized protein n=1 Tax=Petromyces alliaceus TaxID=209559 RepID=A0A8H5ZVE7_PETAA|nr:hypothetical protein ETB97_007414 [Aspergillus burnettii]
MELPDGDIGVFYRKELPHLTEPIVPHEEAPTAEKMSTGVMKTFSSVKRRQQYSTGTAHLSGCTTMYIISRKGVYTTHWWENVSFDPDTIWRKVCFASQYRGQKHHGRLKNPENDILVRKSYNTRAKSKASWTSD